jgi:hypothetical protein
MEGTLYIPISNIRDMIEETVEEMLTKHTVISWNSCLYFSLYKDYHEGGEITGYTRRHSSYDVSIKDSHILMDISGIYRIDLNFNSLDSVIHLILNDKVIRHGKSCINHIIKMNSGDYLKIRSTGEIHELYLNITMIDSEDDVVVLEEE